MRLIALLNFYREDPSWLADTILSLPMAGVTHVVASDGGYVLFPDATGSSGRESHEAIMEACDLAGIGLTLQVHKGPWEGNEIEKRSVMFQLGERHDPDWYLILDADERVIRCPADLHERLGATSADQADVMSLEQPSKVMHAMAEGADWPQIHYSRHVKPRRCLIRAVHGLTCGPRHLDYMTPDGRNLWGDLVGDPLRIRTMMIDHRNAHRSEERRQAALDYYEARTAANAEPQPPEAPPSAMAASPEKIAASNRLLKRAIQNYNAASRS